MGLVTTDSILQTFVRRKFAAAVLSQGEYREVHPVNKTGNSIESAI